MHISKSKNQRLKALALGGMLAGLAACSNDPAINFSEDEAALFKESCLEEGGKIHETTCDGTSQCAGTYLDGESGEVITTTCAGTNSCAGIQCITDDSHGESGDSSQENPSSEASTTDSEQTAAIFKASSAEEFRSECEKMGKSVQANTTCAGYNSCAGIYFDSAKGTVSDVSCAGHATCAGLKCEA
jgi:hypothetical protein